MSAAMKQRIGRRGAKHMKTIPTWIVTYRASRGRIRTCKIRTINGAIRAGAKMLSVKPNKVSAKRA